MPEAEIQRIMTMTAIGVQAGLSDQEIKAAIKSSVSAEEFARQHGVTKLNDRLAKGMDILRAELDK